MDDWRTLLARARRRLGVSRARVADQAGVSSAIVRAYETGRREPSRETLEAMLRALRVDRREGNAIRDGAGFAPQRYPLSDLPSYFYTLEELRQTVECAPWPEFVTDNDFALVAANALTQRLWDFDIEAAQLQRPPPLMNILSVLGEPRICGHLENWDQILEGLVALYKGWLSDQRDGDTPSDQFTSIVSRLTPHNPDVLIRMVQAWPRARGVSPRVRMHYDVIWNGGALGRMRFRSIVATANERDGLDFNDWIPSDAETWDALERLKQQCLCDR